MSAVTDLPVVPGSTVGIVANPMSGRDIRRLVAQASVFPNAEKTNMVLRLLAAAGAAGVERALLPTDGMGVAGGVARGVARRRRSETRLPALEFVELRSLTGDRLGRTLEKLHRSVMQRLAVGDPGRAELLEPAGSVSHRSLGAVSEGEQPILLTLRGFLRLPQGGGSGDHLAGTTTERAHPGHRVRTLRHGRLRCTGALGIAGAAPRKRQEQGQDDDAAPATR